MRKAAREDLILDGVQKVNSGLKNRISLIEAKDIFSKER